MEFDALSSLARNTSNPDTVRYDFYEKGTDNWLGYMQCPTDVLRLGVCGGVSRKDRKPITIQQPSDDDSEPTLRQHIEAIVMMQSQQAANTASLIDQLAKQYLVEAVERVAMPHIEVPTFTETSATCPETSAGEKPDTNHAEPLEAFRGAVLSALEKAVEGVLTAFEKAVRAL